MPKNLEISYLLDFYGDMLTDKQKDAVELYYNEDLSLGEIAEHSGITRQGVRDSIKRAETQLLEYESRLGLAARMREQERTLDEIIRLAQEIEQVNDRFGASNEIYARVAKIVRFARELQQ